MNGRIMRFGWLEEITDGVILGEIYSFLFAPKF